MLTAAARARNTRPEWRSSGHGPGRRPFDENQRRHRQIAEAGFHFGDSLRGVSEGFDEGFDLDDAFLPQTQMFERLEEIRHDRLHAVAEPGAGIGLPGDKHLPASR